MELDELKSIWTEIETPSKSGEEVREMLKENKHPVLKSIRKQFTIEIVGWVAFLFCYYTMFDGAGKPVSLNIVLIIAVSTPLIHNLYGYNFAKYFVDASTIKNFLEGYLRKVKMYMVFSILSRIVFLCGLMLFFSYNISKNSPKYFFLVATTLLLASIQTFFLYKIWSKRIADLGKTLSGLS